VVPEVPETHTTPEALAANPLCSACRFAATWRETRVPPSHADIVQAHLEATRRFQATYHAFGDAVTQLWLALQLAHPNDTQLTIGTRTLVHLTQHLQTLIDVMERHHAGTSTP
jgi:hypothetical protein